MADLRWRLSNGVVIVTPYALGGERATRMYELLPSTIERIHNFHPELMESDIPSSHHSERWKEFFQQNGIDWPIGASIEPLPLIGRILVTNTLENLQLFENVLDAINTYPAQSGRFRLLYNQGEDQQMLILLDSQIGHTWQYIISEYDSDSEEIQNESFTYINH